MKNKVSLHHDSLSFIKGYNNIKRDYLFKITFLLNIHVYNIHTLHSKNGRSRNEHKCSWSTNISGKLNFLIQQEWLCCKRSEHKRKLSMRWPPSYLSPTYATCVWRVYVYFRLFSQCLHWLWKRTRRYLSRNNTLRHGRNRLWHNVKPSQLGVGSSHCQQIESWAQLEAAELWLIVHPYRWKGRSGIAGSPRSGHQFVSKWKLQNSKALSVRESTCSACAKTVT